MAAGTGVRPSEFNPSREKKAHFLQIWIKPDQLGAFPRYAGQSFKNADSRKLHLVTSKTGREGSIAINQDADLWLAKLESSDRASHTLKAGRHAWVQVAEGEITLNGTKFSAGDAAAVSEETDLELRADEKSQVLLFDLN